MAIPERGRTAPARGYLVVIVGASLFAWLGPLSRWAYDAGMEPLPFVAWRAAIGAVFLLAVVAVTLRRGARFVAPWRLQRGELATFTAAATMALLLNLSMFAAFSRITVALALLGFYTYPAMVAVVAVALGRERLSAWTVAALALALIGMAVVVAGSVAPGAVVVDGVGVLLALTAAACQTVFVTVSRDGYRSLPADQAMGWILAASALGSVAIAVASGTTAAVAEPLRNAAVAPILLAAGTLGAGLPSLLFLAGIRLVGGTRAGILMLLEPVVAVVLAAWLLGEALRPIQVLGGAAVLGAALLLQRATRASAPPHETSASGTVAGHGRFADQ